MAALNELVTPSLTFEEILSDGSTLTNPAADSRRLFLGEDGLFHMKDSAGTVTDVGGSGGSVATDAIWDAPGDLPVGTGANTAARLALGAVGSVLGRINGAVAWNAGTAFPASKATDDRFYRSDLDMGFFWDGTRWVSTTLYHMAFQATGSQAASFSALWPMPGNLAAGDIFVYSLDTTFYIVGGTALSGSHKWVGLFGRLKSDNTGLTATLATVTIDSGASSVWRHDIQTVNAVAAYDLTAGPLLDTIWTKTGTPGNLWHVAVLSYRVIAT